MTFTGLPLFAETESSLSLAIAQDIVPVTAIVSGMVLGFVFIIWISILTVTSERGKFRVAEQNAVLKKEMLDRGFSADDIVRVIQTNGTVDKLASRPGVPRESST